jgi:hypothetical protein
MYTVISLSIIPLCLLARRSRPVVN